MKNICDWNNCFEIGEYKAPIEKDNSKKYRLLCLEHIKIFNKNWNYFENMDDQQIEYFIKSDLNENVLFHATQSCVSAWSQGPRRPRGKRCAGAGGVPGPPGRPLPKNKLYKGYHRKIFLFLFSSICCLYVSNICFTIF